MEIELKNTINMKCIKCGGSKYFDDPYLISDTWFVDVVCINCGHSATSELTVVETFLEKVKKS